MVSRQLAQGHGQVKMVHRGKPGCDHGQETLQKEQDHMDRHPGILFKAGPDELKAFRQESRHCLKEGQLTRQDPDGKNPYYQGDMDHQHCGQSLGQDDLPGLHRQGEHQISLLL